MKRSKNKSGMFAPRRDTLSETSSHNRVLLK